MINGGGVINVYGEIEGWSDERAKQKAAEIYDTLQRVVRRGRSARRSRRTEAADRLAEERLQRGEGAAGGSPTVKVAGKAVAPLRFLPPPIHWSMAELIPIGSDHAGFALKERLMQRTRALGYEPLDLGTHSTESTDYPDFAHPVAAQVEHGEVTRGILLCGTGLGMAYAANRHPGCGRRWPGRRRWRELARAHNDANVLVLPARFVSEAGGRGHPAARGSTRPSRAAATPAGSRRSNRSRGRMLDHNAPLREADPAVARLIDAELRRQQHGLELIASENFASRAVIDAMGTPLTNKYAEGYPGQAVLRRLRGGGRGRAAGHRPAEAALRRRRTPTCSRTRAPRPTSRRSWRCCQAGRDQLMGMSLPHGGHLSHGAAVNHSGRIWQAVHYGVDPATGPHRLRPGARPWRRRERPKLIIAGGSAYARIIDFAAFRSIADEVGAIFLVDMAHFAGLVAGGRLSLAGAARAGRHQHHAQDAARARGPGSSSASQELAKAIDKSVFPGHPGRAAGARHRRQGGGVRRGAAPPDFKDYARQVVENAKALAEALVERGFAIVSGGTDTHLMLVDLRPKGLTGKEAEKLLGQGGHHRQQEHHSRRPAVALRHQRHPARHAGAHHPRHGHGRDAAHRAAHRPGADPARTTPPSRGSRARCSEMTTCLPAVPAGGEPPTACCRRA